VIFSFILFVQSLGILRVSAVLLILRLPVADEIGDMVWMDIANFLDFDVILDGMDNAIVDPRGHVQSWYILSHHYTKGWFSDAAFPSDELRLVSPGVRYAMLYRTYTCFRRRSSGVGEDGTGVTKLTPCSDNDEPPNICIHKVVLVLHLVDGLG
jgi:hypothetical protein